jgi:trans-2,3-dihydro-3-hydroxyanthranilate isomerase
MMAGRAFHIVDVFAEEKYAGNQLAVVPAAGNLSPAIMQQIANEMHFSETTFITATTVPGAVWKVRIFTPATEVPFAGHPTLGTAWVIRHELLGTGVDSLTLDLPIGRVPVHFAPEPNGREMVWMQPREPIFGDEFPASPIAAALGLGEDDIDRRAPVQAVSAGIPFALIPLRTLAAVRRARFDRSAARRLADAHPRAWFLFAAETYDPANQLNARMFADDFGVPEDPATGSAAACLGAYLARHRYFGDTDIDVRIEQGFEIGRPSLLRVRAQAAVEGFQVQVGGRVIPVARGELL